jgi:type I restriction enzyme R subunit
MIRYKLGEWRVEEAAVEYFTGAGPAIRGLGWQSLHGSELTPEVAPEERATYADTILEQRFRRALRRINPQLPDEALDAAARAVLQLNSPSLEENNLAFHRMLTRGVIVEVRKVAGVRGELVRLVDWEEPGNNDWLVVRQFTVVEEQANRNERRPDVVVFLNGLPVAVFELKDPTDPEATLERAWNQLQTYKRQIPRLFYTNAVLVISDGRAARVGSLTAPLERFGPWRTVDGETRAPKGTPELQTLVNGLFEKRRLLDYLRYFGFWEQDPDTGKLVKKTAAWHQFYGIRKAVDATVAASRREGDGRAGVVWHTQGSGKSVSMALFAGKIVQRLDNPTLVVLTDRNDLDDQLFRQFAAARDLFAQKPVQAESREHLRELLQVPSGGIVFTTIQKFGTARGERIPCLTDRHNVVVIADEAHRSHYEFVEGFARNLRDALPNATLIGFTGTPIELQDRSTPEVFGDYIDAYTIAQAVEDGATVPIYYESRLAALDLPEGERPRLDEGFAEVTEDEEITEVVKLQSPWKQLASVVGLRKRLKLIARDIVEHYERRCEILEGKALVVCMSRQICVDLYREIARLRPEWTSDRDEEGQLKVVITGSASDPPDFEPHVRNARRRKTIEKRFKESIEDAVKDGRPPLRMVIVRDMWLTGFDVPSLHTLYVDKPMQGHTLMQAVARVNRVFQDKPSGLVVDYLGLAENLREAVETYGHHRERTSVPIEEALAQLRTELGVVRDLFFGFDYSAYFSGSPATCLAVLTGAVDHMLGLESAEGPDGRTVSGEDRFLGAMTRLNQAAAISIHLEGARDLRDEVGFFQQVQKTLRKPDPHRQARSAEALNLAIKQLVSGAISTGGVMDLFELAGVPKPDLSILSDEFLRRVRSVPQKNLQIELLRRLVDEEIRHSRRHSVVKVERFSEMLQETINRYRNGALETTEVIRELIGMAEELRAEAQRGNALGLSDDELAFYDALVAQGGVREVMDDAALGVIASDLVKAIRESVTLDWTQKETVRAKMRARVKRLLRRHGYPPDKQEDAVRTVLRQAEAFGWTVGEGVG